MQKAPGRNVRGLSVSISFEAGLAPSSSPAAVRDLLRGGLCRLTTAKPPDEMSEGLLCDWGKTLRGRLAGAKLYALRLLS